MVELNGGRVLKDVAPPVRLVLVAAVEILVELVRRRVQLAAHQRPLVVDQTGVEAGDKGACIPPKTCASEAVFLRQRRKGVLTGEGGREDERSHDGSQSASPTDRLGLQPGEGLFDRLPPREPFHLAREFPVPRGAKPEPQARRIDEERHPEMGREAVLTHARDASQVFDGLLVQSALDHVPTEGTLSSDEGRDAEEGEEGAAAELARVGEVGDRGEEGKADDAAEDAVRPLPHVDGLELFERDVLVVAARCGPARGFTAKGSESAPKQREKNPRLERTHIFHSGVALYLSNSTSHSWRVMGSLTPLTTFHSVIERPLSVKRVMPPTTTMAKTRPAMTKRYLETRGEVSGTSGGSGKVEPADSAAPAVAWCCWWRVGSIAVADADATVDCSRTCCLRI